MTTRSDLLGRRAMLGGAAALGAATLAGCGSRANSKAGEVIVCDGGGAWGRAQRLAFYEPFAKATGVRIRTVPYVMAGKLRTSIEQGRPAIDVADMSGADLPRFVRDGLLTPLERSAFDPADLSALAPAKATDFAVPSLYSSVLLAYRAEAFGGRQPNGWPDFWAAAQRGETGSLATGTLGVLGSTFQIALLGDGVTPENLYPLDWDRVFRSLDRIKPHIRKFWASGGEPLQMLADRNATMSSAWSGRIDLSQVTQTGIDFTWNQGVFGAAYWAVPKGALNRENAFRFMAFALRPDRQAHFSRLIGYGPANPRAFALMTPDRIALMPNAPNIMPHQISSNVEWWAKEDRPGETNLDLAVRLWEAWVTRST